MVISSSIGHYYLYSFRRVDLTFFNTPVLCVMYLSSARQYPPKPLQQ